MRRMFSNFKQRCFMTDPPAMSSSNKTFFSSKQTIGFFSKQERFIKKMKIASKETFCRSPSAEAVEASFEIAHMIAQAKKPHSIGETIINPCMIKAAILVLGVASSN